MYIYRHGEERRGEERRGEERRGEERRGEETHPNVTSCISLSLLPCCRLFHVVCPWTAWWHHVSLCELNTWSKGGDNRCLSPVFALRPPAKSVSPPVTLRPWPRHGSHQIEIRNILVESFFFLWVLEKSGVHKCVISNGLLENTGGWCWAGMHW